MGLVLHKAKTVPSGDCFWKNVGAAFVPRFFAATLLLIGARRPLPHFGQAASERR